MIPQNGLAGFYVRVAGEGALLSMAQANLLANFERVVKFKTHVFLSNNAQNEYGVSRNEGAERFFSWNDTVVDCRHSPSLPDSDQLHALLEEITERGKFQKLKENLESRLGGLITIEPFFSVLRGEDNMRYNICRRRKIEDFDTVRVGLRFTAADDQAFKQGLKHLGDEENPFKMKSQGLYTSTAMA